MIITLKLRAFRQRYWKSNNSSLQVCMCIARETKNNNGSSSKHRKPNEVASRSLSPFLLVQLPSQPAGALLAPGGQAGCDDSPMTAGSAVAQPCFPHAVMACVGWMVRWAAAGTLEQWLARQWQAWPLRWQTKCNGGLHKHSRSCVH